MTAFQVAPLTVTYCYDLLDLSVTGKIEDYTEGIYILNKAFGGFYPVAGQLKRCADGIFELEKEVNGTRDYFLTSEYWLKNFRKATLLNPVFMIRLASKIVRRPHHTFAMLACVSGPQSWAWQFRTDNPPTKLLRQTWRCLG